MSTYEDILSAAKQGMTFAFKTEEDRDLFVAEILKKHPDLPYVANLDPDKTSERQWLVNYPNVGPGFQDGLISSTIH